MEKSIIIKRSSNLFMTVLLILANLFLSQAYADVRLPRIFSDNMVLQREAPVKIWGWADPGTRVRVNILNQNKSTRADRSGNWSVTLDPMRAGGPVELTIQGRNTLRLSNVLIGDVWLGSGQSNMEWPVSLSANAQEEISLANHHNIRLFTVPRHMSGSPTEDIESGEWQVCSPETVEQFSAVGYYFARYLNLELEVPIGIINSSWGGTNAETWISHESISRHEDFAERMKHGPGFDLEKIQNEARKKLEEWNRNVEASDLGSLHGWKDSELDDNGWGNMELPVLWEQAGLADTDGVVWFRKEFYLTQSQAKENIILNLGRIDDSDYTYVNGQQVGQTLDQYNVIRRYEVPSAILKPGRNVIVVRVIDTGGGGGIWGDENQLFYLAGKENVSLAGMWKYCVGIKTDAPPQVTAGPNSYPTLLFNGMIYPVKPFTLKGIIWYQGESNTGRAYQYRTLFPLLINDWRKQFNNPEMPFFFVQLANYMQADKNPSDSYWAELREAQAMTLSLPNTGMAVAIDIGEADDIHPRNKQDVGKRLALAALKVSYGKDTVHSGPMYSSMSIVGNKIRLNFTDTGSGLMIRDKYGYPKGFAIAGEDRVFHWAKAKLEGNQVVVFSEAVVNPVAVRYAWGNNPDDANLYNIEGLPAPPFRTDNWRGITQGNR